MVWEIVFLVLFVILIGLVAYAMYRGNRVLRGILKLVYAIENSDSKDYKSLVVNLAAIIELMHKGRGEWHDIPYYKNKRGRITKVMIDKRVG